MKFLTKAIVLIIMLIMLSANAFADETNRTLFQATMNENDVSVEEIELDGSIDNSNLQVKVVKQVGSQLTTIYTGKLGDYENGKWSNVDFTGMYFLALFDWETMENEVTYIVPIEPENSTLFASTNESDYVTLEDLDSSLISDVKIIYNNEYYESILIPNNTLNVSITVSNLGAATELVCYLAEYNSAGRLIDLKSNNTISVPANGSITANLTRTFTNADVTLAKIFVWEENNLKPITNSILLQSQQLDYYADTYTSAQNYDISKTINGKINTTSDIDYIKFVSDVSGTYIIQTTGIETMGALYNGSHTLISNGIAENGNFYIKENFVANETYYIKIYGNSIGAYSLTIKESQSLQVNIYNTALSINGDISSVVDNSDSVTIKFLNSNGVALNTQTVNTSASGELNAIIPVVVVENGQYKAIASANGKIISVIDINILKNTVSYSENEGEFCSVPYVVSNVTTLENVYFSLVFNSDDFEIYDVCDYTLLVENGTGLISGGNVRILENTDICCIFKSTRTTSNWSGTVNSIKLKSKRAGTKETTRFVYQVK